MSAYGPHEPRYTNFTGSFVGVLDYIFFTKNHLRVLGSLDMPSDEVVSEFTALPSPRFPSDHLPLVADFDWLSGS
jgi:mRNA deadenylase 3'-5' endonuclease subunit Ccr4